MMGGFEISAGVDTNKVFLVYRSELADRFDPAFHSEMPDVRHFVKLSSVASVKGGKRIPLGQSYSLTKTPFLYLRVTDINKNGAVNFDNLNFIDADVFQALQRYEIHQGQLAISIAGTIGRILLLENIPPNKKIILTENCAKIILKNDEINPKYFFLILNLPVVQKQFELNYIQTTIPKLGLDRINNLYIPEIPSLATQQLIVSFYQDQCHSTQQKEQQAQALLDGIDSYLLNELGISLPESDNRLEKRIFIVPFREVTGERLDPDYHKLSYHEIISQVKKSKYPLVALSEITHLLASGKTPASFEYSETPTAHPIIKVGSYSKNYIDLDKTDYALQPQKLEAKRGDIFILSAAHQSEYVGRHIKYLNEMPKIQTSFVGELICVRANENCNSMFLFSLLTLEIFKVLINREKTGQTSHVYASDLKHLNIPLPPLAKQNEIAVHISNIRAQAKQLQQEAAQILSEAKAEIERMILGEAA